MAKDKKKDKKKDKTLKVVKIVKGVKKYTSLSMIKSNLLLSSTYGEVLPIKFINNKKGVMDELFVDKKTIIMFSLPQKYKLLISANENEGKTEEPTSTSDVEKTLIFTMNVKHFLNYVALAMKKEMNSDDKDVILPIKVLNDKGKEVCLLNSIVGIPEIFQNKGKNGISVFMNI